MINTLSINTGAPRNVTGHFISGALVSSFISGSINYKKLKNNEITKKAFVENTLRSAAQGGIATAAAIATTNYIGNGNIIGAMSAISIGAMGIYGTEKFYDKLEIEVKKTKEVENAK